MQPSATTQIRIAGLFANKARQAAMRTLLDAAGLDFVPAASISALMAMLRDAQADVLLLEDTGPALGDWLGMLQLRAAGTAPVIVAGTPAGLGMAEALLLGAADYIDPDAAAGPLAARLRAHAGSRRSLHRQHLDVGPFSLCSSTCTAQCDGKEISLTAREFALAWALSSRAGRIVPLASLSAHVWGRCSDVCKRTLEQHVYKLRRKLGATGGGRLRIQAIYGIGYRLDVLHAADAPAPAMSH